MADLVLAYTSTIGLEAALMGKPVLVGADTHYRGKGFTYDVSSEEEFVTWLTDFSLCPPLTAEAIELARRYAYNYFFRFGLPFDLVEEGNITDGNVTLRFDSLRDLEPGKNKTLDVICDGILNNEPFLPRS
jgi:hypothetical protein